MFYKNVNKVLSFKQSFIIKCFNAYRFELWAINGVKIAVVSTFLSVIWRPVAKSTFRSWIQFARSCSYACAFPSWRMQFCRLCVCDNEWCDPWGHSRNFRVANERWSAARRSRIRQKPRGAARRSERGGREARRRSYWHCGEPLHWSQGIFRSVRAGRVAMAHSAAVCVLCLIYSSRWEYRLLCFHFRLNMR